MRQGLPTDGGSPCRVKKQNVYVQRRAAALMPRAGVRTVSAVLILRRVSPIAPTLQPEHSTRLRFKAVEDCGHNSAKRRLSLFSQQDLHHHRTIVEYVNPTMDHSIPT